jgi:hypothetical protein
MQKGFRSETPLPRSKYKCDDINKIDIKEITCQRLGLLELALDKFQV